MKLISAPFSMEISWNRFPQFLAHLTHCSPFCRRKSCLSLNFPYWQDIVVCLVEVTPAKERGTFFASACS
jgi:hypothetical protein